MAAGGSEGRRRDRRERNGGVEENQVRGGREPDGNGACVWYLYRVGFLRGVVVGQCSGVCVAAVVGRSGRAPPPPLAEEC